MSTLLCQRCRKQFPFISRDKRTFPNKFFKTPEAVTADGKEILCGCCRDEIKLSSRAFKGERMNRSPSDDPSPGGEDAVRAMEG
jgi:hypothetical protein